jgi:hypothetical protein
MPPPPLPPEFPPCTCDRCQALCQRPGWPTPAEAGQLLAAGYGPSLMLAWWERPRRQGGNILVLCPAVADHEGFYALTPEDWPLYDETRRCVMQIPDGLCQLHATGLKPLESRLASGCAPYEGCRRGAPLPTCGQPQKANVSSTTGESARASGDL